MTVTEAVSESSTAADVPLLDVVDLSVEFRTDAGVVHAVNGLSYQCNGGETVAILGESGSGKSVSAQAVMGIIDSPPGFITSGELRYRGTDLLALTEEERQRIRGAKIAMVFQDALTALNPVFTVGWQIGEMFRRHQGMSKKKANVKAVELMERVKIPGARDRIHAYPHELSGGMRQRIMIAMGIALDPDVLIADEPTTALDVTVQAQIMDLLAELQAETGMGLILITHDLGVVAEVADRVVVMYAGREVEKAPIHDLFATPKHPYTEGLMHSIPRPDQARGRLDPIQGSPPDLLNIPPGCAFHPRCPHVQDPVPHRRPAAAHGQPRSGASERLSLRRGAVPVSAEPILRVRDLVKHFPITRGIVLKRQIGTIKAVDGVSFDLMPGETLGLVGESGCGKSTTARTILRLEKATAGVAEFEGKNIFSMTGRDLRFLRRKIQVIFQDPYASLNPRMTVGDIIGEGWKIHSDVLPVEKRRPRIQELLELVGPQSRSQQSLSASVLRRPASAHRHRTGPGAQPVGDRRRRAGLRPRRFGAGAGGELARRSPEGARARLSVHRPRSVGRPPHL